MASGYGDSSSSSAGSSNDAGSSFDCNICLELAEEPVVTLCGHLFCWPCLYRWLHIHAHSHDCPVCKAVVLEDKIVPLYGRGKTPSDPRSRSGNTIPSRPAGKRAATATPPDPNQFPHPNPWFMGGAGAPVRSTRFGNSRFSAVRRWGARGWGTILSWRRSADWAAFFRCSMLIGFRMLLLMGRLLVFLKGMPTPFMVGMGMGICVGTSGKLLSCSRRMFSRSRCFWLGLLWLLL